MPLSSNLLTLAQYLAGEFDNRHQAIADPTWFVHLRLWHRPVPQLTTADSLTLFAEQANVLHPENPYRQRLFRLMAQADQPASLHVQYYSFNDPGAVSGAGQHPERLQKITTDDIKLLPGCILTIQQPQTSVFLASAPPDAACFFSYQGEKRQVLLGFESREHEFFSYDKGVEPETGKALWGAIMGPYQFQKQQNYGNEWNLHH